MPTLAAVLDHLGPLLADRAKAERSIRREFGGQRIYVAPPDSRKDGTRAQRIRELSKRLPVRVIAERLQCSRQHVYATIKRPKP